MTTVVVFIIGGRFAAAQVALKPTGQNALPLRAKSITATVRVQKSRFATTDLELVFANELGNRVEADFLYTVPDGAAVSDFAYFYGKERVPARIAEKARAAAIYKAITTRQRDPALVEMVGKNTFRARIFPVEPNADLRVQIRYVQVLPVGADGRATLALPLQTPKSVKWDSVSVAVRVLGDASGVANNFGIPAMADAGGGTMLSFRGTNYRTEKNLRVSLPVPKADTTPYMAATSGGAEGFFAATITAPPGSRLDPASLQLSGVPVYALSTHRLSGRDVLVTGRYRKPGTARFSLRDAATGKRVSSSILTFTGAAEANSPATKLWAAAQIERLSKRDTNANRKEGIALSKRFTLPSRWTSWIAIPIAERKLYERDQAQRKMYPVAEKLYNLQRRGRGASAAANALRSQFFALCTTAEQSDPQDTLRQYLSDAAYRRDEAAQSRKDSRREAAATPLVTRLYTLIRKGEGNGSEAAVLRERFARLFAASGYSDKSGKDELKQRLTWQANDAITAAVQKTVQAIAKGGQNSAEAKQNRAILDKRCAEIGENVAEMLTNNAYGAIQDRLQSLTDLVAEGKAQTTVGIRLQQEIEWLKAVDNGASKDTLQDILKWKMENAARNWVWQSRGEAPNYDWENSKWRFQKIVGTPGQAEKLRVQVERLAQAVGVTPQSVLDKVQQPWYAYALQTKRDAVIAAYKKPSAPGETAKREAEYLAETRTDRQQVVDAEAGKYFYGANTPDGREAFAKDRLARIAARTEATRLEAELQTPLSADEKRAMQTRITTLWQTETQLRARMGDPLLFVDAPRDALSVTATLPNGEIVPLAWDDAANRWQCRFDIPTYAAEGDYVVAVEIVRADGSHTAKTFTYTVDTTAPTGTATLGDGLLEVLADADTVRAVAVLDSGDTVNLNADPSRPGRFWARVTGGVASVVLTDRAHNRATLSVTAAKGGNP